MDLLTDRQYGPEVGAPLFVLGVMDLEPQAEEDIVAPSDDASVNLPSVRDMRLLWHRRLAHVGDAAQLHVYMVCQNELRTSPCVCAVRLLSLQSSGAHEMHGMLEQHGQCNGCIWT